MIYRQFSMSPLWRTKIDIYILRIYECIKKVQVFGGRLEREASWTASSGCDGCLERLSLRPPIKTATPIQNMSMMGNTIKAQKRICRVERVLGPVENPAQGRTENNGHDLSMTPKPVVTRSSIDNIKGSYQKIFPATCANYQNGTYCIPTSLVS